MARPSPLLPIHEQAGAATLPFGDAGEIVGEYEVLETEYAALRKAVAMMDLAQRGLIELRGKNRLTLLHRLLSRNCESLEPGRGDRMLMLNETGRIEADLVVLNGDGVTLLDVDADLAPGVAQKLDSFIFGEDVQIDDVSSEYHCLVLHGPGAAALLDQVGVADVGSLRGFEHCEGRIDEVNARVYRHDLAGVPGLHLWVPADGATRAWEKLIAHGAGHRLKPIGWFAFNTARIEAGCPMFHLDFGPDSLPHETGIVDQLVDFNKGCYRGQEIVARMRSLGHPRQQLCGFRATGDDLPPTGTPLMSRDGEHERTVGAVTSSTFSPMLSDQAIGFAMMRWGAHEPGQTFEAILATGRSTVTTCSMDFLASVQSDGRMDSSKS
jgi:folate-binding protein YgfZ